MVTGTECFWLFVAWVLVAAASAAIAWVQWKYA